MTDRDALPSLGDRQDIRPGRPADLDDDALRSAQRAERLLALAIRWAKRRVDGVDVAQAVRAFKAFADGDDDCGEAALRLAIKEAAELRLAPATLEGLLGRAETFRRLIRA